MPGWASWMVPWALLPPSVCAGQCSLVGAGYGALQGGAGLAQIEHHPGDVAGALIGAGHVIGRGARTPDHREKEEENWTCNAHR